MAGLEPTTSRFRTVCSSHLNYIPKIIGTSVAVLIILKYKPIVLTFNLNYCTM